MKDICLTDILGATSDGSFLPRRIQPKNIPHPTPTVKPKASCLSKKSCNEGWLGSLPTQNARQCECHNVL